ncbi:MAG: PAS domain-containing protein [Proteobacteria bacterium]|nr:PAS domain-containing protein [Pseudomonadota bacterium]
MRTGARRWRGGVLVGLAFALLASTPVSAVAADPTQAGRAGGGWILGNLVAVVLALLSVALLMLVWNAMLRRVVAEQTAKLRRSEERFALAEAGTNDGIWDWDLRTGAVYFSPRFKELIGCGDVDLDYNWEAWRSRIHPDDLPDVMTQLDAHLQRRTPRFRCEHRLRHKDGSWHWALARGKALWDEQGNAYRMVGALSDVTERRRLEQQLAQAQKMEALGQLTGGVAHDFNNRLTAILGNLELIEDRPGLDEEGHSLARSAIRSVLRSAELTRRLLAFSHQQSFRPEIVDLNELLTGLKILLQRTLGESVEVKFELAVALGKTRVDPGQMENAILNLAINARDAMPNGGRLAIETANVELQQKDLVGGTGDIGPGRYVVLTASDTGGGMSAEQVEGAFDPFFVAENARAGRGLGLGMVYGFVKQSGGYVRIDSAAGRGTAISLYLRRETAGGDADAALDAEAEAHEHETILVVDDDPEVRDFLDTVLSSLGYRVMLAPDGQVALDLVSRSDRIDLMLTDIGLPGGMRGPDLARKAAALKSGLRILFMSGYAEKEQRDGAAIEADAELLHKPFRKSELAATIRRTLDRAQV